MAWSCGVEGACVRARRQGVCPVGVAESWAECVRRRVRVSLLHSVTTHYDTSVRVCVPRRARPAVSWAVA